MTKKNVADTPLAKWLNEEMGNAVDPDSGEIGLSTFRLAQLMDVSQTLIWDILKNGTVPKRVDKLIEIGQYFGKEPMYMFRLAYLGDLKDYPPEVEQDLLEIEQLVSQLPRDMQVDYISSLLEQAKLLYTAAMKWRIPEKARQS